MVGYLFSYVLALLMLLGGGRDGTDLLETISTADYWQMEHVTPDLAQLKKDADADPPPQNIDSLVRDLGAVDFGTRDKARQDLERMGPAILSLLKPIAASTDPEVAAVAQELVKKFTERGQERAIRRLMAIRTLGERRESEALDLLNTLKDSKELFVPEYARRAIDAVKGQPHAAPPDLAGRLAADLALMPADTALVAQSSGLSTRKLTIATLIEEAIASDVRNQMALPPNVAPAKPDAAQMRLQVSRQLLVLLERIGNVRFDGVTVGFNYTRTDKPQEEEHGWFALILRGQYDSAAALQAIRDASGGDLKITPAEAPGDVTILRDTRGTSCLLMPDNQRLIMLDFPSPDPAVIDAFVASIKAGKGTLGENKELAAMLKTIDVKSPLWVAGRIPEAISREIMDGAIKSVTLESKLKEGGLTAFTLKAEAVDADKAKTVVQDVNSELKSATDDLKVEVVRQPALKPMADLLGSIKVSADGPAATMTGELPPDMMSAVLGEIPLLELVNELAPSEAQRRVTPVEPLPVEQLP